MMRRVSGLALFLIVFFLHLVLVPPALARRLVSLSPGITEILAAIGVGEEIVGRTRFCTFPPSVERATVVGDLQVSVEKVLLLKPDLILTQPDFHHREREFFAQSGLPCHTIPLARLDDVPRAMRQLGLSLDAPGGEISARKFEAALALLKQSTAATVRRPRVAILVADQPLMAAGGGTFLDELLELCGGHNVFATGNGYFQIGREGLLRQDPDIILLTYTAPVEAPFTGVAGPMDLRAHQNRRIHTIDPDLVSRPGPRLATAARELFRLLHGNKKQ